MKKAAEISDIVMKKIPDLTKEGMYEYELAAKIDYLLNKNGADKPAFHTISSFGENTSKPHYAKGNKKLNKGDFIVCDFGASYKKYNSDITRTFVFKKCSKKQKGMYDAVLNAQKIGLEKIKAGVKASEVHRSVLDYINNTSFKGFFIHSTGHSLGIDVHDGGIGLDPNSNDELKENMVLTVEPGIYLPGFGGVRIEDDIVVKKDGYEFLTKSSKKILIE
ncbi:MAG: M24 family metallopeptidase [Candidatus Thermoplasmatota archaeon]